MLKIITGRIASSKTSLLIEDIGKRIKNKQRSILLVPDPVTYNFEQRLCTQLNINGFIDVEVCSFNRFASSVIDFYGKNRKAYLDDTAKAMVVRLCLLQVEDKLTIFKSTAGRKGFAERCLNMISTLQNCGYTVNDINEVCAKLDDSILKMKLADTAVIYEAYLSMLEKGYTDNADKLKTAGELLPYYFKENESVIFIDGFDIYTTHLYNFLGKLISATDVVITLASVEDGSDADAYRIHADTFKQLIGIANELGVPYSVTHAKAKDTDRSPEINHLKQNLYSNNFSVYTSPCKSIYLDYYQSATEEITAIAKDILKDVRTGKRFKDHALLCNDLTKYTPIVNSVFKRYEIPVYTDIPHDITAHPVAVYLFSLLRCVYNGISPENITDYLLSGITGITREEKDFFLSFINAMGLKGYELENGLYYKRTDDALQAEFDVLRKRIMEPVLCFRQGMLSCRTARDMAAQCYSFMEAQDVYTHIQALVDEYEARNCFELSDITAQLWNKLMQLLESLSTLAEEQNISVEEFSLTLTEGFKASPVSTIPSVLDCVTFGDLSAAKEQTHTHVYIVGANEGVIPAVYTDERLVTLQESKLLTELGFELQHSEEKEDARIRYNVYAAMCTPTSILHFSCPLFTNTGGALRPSPLFKRLRQLYKNINETHHSKLLSSNELSAPCTKAQLMFSMAQNSENEEAQALGNYFEGDAEYAKLLQALSTQEHFLPKDVAKALFFKNEAVSISRLETFAECPFAHFINYGLLPEATKSYIADALDIGNILHYTLEEFTKTQDTINSKEECFKLTADIFEKIAPDVHFGVFLSTERQKAFNAHLKTLVSESAWVLKENLREFTPIGGEISFGYGKKYPPIEIPTEYGTLYLKGKIDRADTLTRNDRTYIRIVDYKSGNDTFRESDIDNGTNLQLTTYMRALLNYYSNAVPASAQYMQLANDNQFSGPILKEFSRERGAYTEEKFDQLLERSENKLKELADDVLSGNIIQKKSKNNCEKCEYRCICQYKNKEENQDANMD